MNSTTSMITEVYRIQQWDADIHEYQMRLKDVSVAAWCHDHGITKANYYYRLRRVRQACPSHCQASHRIICGKLKWTGCCAVLCDYSIEVRNLISVELLEKLIQLVQHA
ncbi:hypothetical protein [Lacrimispora indolis]|uniref:hypothetical protein n=1 Tax=Lacrimispora indolis TaxID=69825 RepID=UPI00045E609C|nr:hypothetical protein [Lacrimispora indolis]